MTHLNFEFSNSKFSNESLNSSISKILNSNILGSFATISNNESYIHTAYFCYNTKLELYFISDPETHHVKNIINNSSVAVAIYDSSQPWNSSKCGLQIFGKCMIAKGTHLIDGTMLYLKRFSGLKQWIQHPSDFIKGAINSKMFVISTSKIRLFDEFVFGEEVFIDLQIN